MVAAKKGCTFPGFQVFSFTNQITHEDSVDTFDADNYTKNWVQRNTTARSKITRQSGVYELVDG
jgi:hypothetical protein